MAGTFCKGMHQRTLHPHAIVGNATFHHVHEAILKPASPYALEIQKQLKTVETEGGKCLKRVFRKFSSVTHIPKACYIAD